MRNLRNWTRLNDRPLFCVAKSALRKTKTILKTYINVVNNVIIFSFKTKYAFLVRIQISKIRGAVTFNTFAKYPCFYRWNSLQRYVTPRERKLIDPSASVAACRRPEMESGGSEVYLRGALSSDVESFTICSSHRICNSHSGVKGSVQLIDSYCGKWGNPVLLGIENGKKIFLWIYLYVNYDYMIWKKNLKYIWVDSIGTRH